LTWRCDFPQKLQRSCSLDSVGRASGIAPSVSLRPAGSFLAQKA
jgi:hypothetical protein